jgi:hypothetical protein
MVAEALVTSHDEGRTATMSAAFRDDPDFSQLLRKGVALTHTETRHRDAATGNVRDHLIG